MPHTGYTAYLSLGTNLGDKATNLSSAIQEIERRIGPIEAQSAFISTEPWGFESENTFLNAAVKVSTELDPFALLRATQAIERSLGRTEKSKDGIYHDRIIDIDILLVFSQGESIVVKSPLLNIPHPLMHERDFVMTPLRQILSAEEKHT